MSVTTSGCPYSTALVFTPSSVLASTSKVKRPNKVRPGQLGEIPACPARTLRSSFRPHQTHGKDSCAEIDHEPIQNHSLRPVWKLLEAIVDDRYLTP